PTVSRVFFSMLRPPPSSTLFPYTTLFRSARHDEAGDALVPLARLADPSEHRVPLGVAGVGDPALLPGDDVLVAHLAYRGAHAGEDRKSTRLNSSHRTISYAVFCLKKKKT